MVKLKGPTKLDPNSKRALQILGFLFLRMGQFARARRLFAALSVIDPEDIQVRQSLAYACVQMNDPEGAMHALSGMVIEDDHSPIQASMHLLLAKTHMLLGEEKAAQESMAAFWKAASQAQKSWISLQPPAPSSLEQRNIAT